MRLVLGDDRRDVEALQERRGDARGERLHRQRDGLGATITSGKLERSDRLVGVDVAPVPLGDGLVLVEIEPCRHGLRVLDLLEREELRHRDVAIDVGEERYVRAPLARLPNRLRARDQVSVLAHAERHGCGALDVDPHAELLEGRLEHGAIMAGEAEREPSPEERLRAVRGQRLDGGAGGLLGHTLTVDGETR